MLPLKEATAEKHRIAEKMPFNNRMFKGELTKPQYLLYLVQQQEIFKTIENIGLPHPDLARTNKIELDIQELIESGCEKPLILNSTLNYCNYLSQLNYEDLLPQIYLNYLAVMFGGQIIRKAVSSKGNMYDFNEMREAMASIRMVQKDEWADEVNKGFDYHIKMFEDLENTISNSASH